MIYVIKKGKYLFLFCLLMVSSLTYAQGSRYTGTYKKSGPIVLTSKSNIVIEGLEFENSKEHSITLLSCNNITIRNCKFKDLKTKESIFVDNSNNITVIDCSFENIYCGFRAFSCNGNIVFEHNDMKNIIGNLYGGPPLVQAVQFDKCNGAGSSISYNVIENIEGESSPDDNINLYKSNGTPESPIRVANNWIRGGGPSRTGGGILLGDNGGSYQLAENNIVVNPGQYGIAIAGGHDLSIRDNNFYSKRRSVANIGIYANNWTEKEFGKSYNIKIENNNVNWTHRDGYYNTAWFSDNMINLIRESKKQNIRNPEITQSILPEVIIGRARKTEEDTPDIDKPDSNTPETSFFDIYTDQFNRVSIKCFMNPMPYYAQGEIYTSSWKMITKKTILGFRTLIDYGLSSGEYNVNVSYRGKDNIVKTISKKIIIK